MSDCSRPQNPMGHVNLLSPNQVGQSKAKEVGAGLVDAHKRAKVKNLKTKQGGSQLNKLPLKDIQMSHRVMLSQKAGIKKIIQNAKLNSKVLDQQEKEQSKLLTAVNHTKKSGLPEKKGLVKNMNINRSCPNIHQIEESVEHQSSKAQKTFRGSFVDHLNDARKNSEKIDQKQTATVIGRNLNAKNSFNKLVNHCKKQKDWPQNQVKERLSGAETDANQELNPDRRKSFKTEHFKKESFLPEQIFPNISKSTDRENESQELDLIALQNSS